MIDIKTLVANAVTQADLMSQSLREGGLRPIITIHMGPAVYEDLKSWVADRVDYPNSFVRASPFLYGRPLLIEQEWDQYKIEIRATVEVTP